LVGNNQNFDNETTNTMKPIKPQRRSDLTEADLYHFRFTPQALHLLRQKNRAGICRSTLERAWSIAKMRQRTWGDGWPKINLQSLMQATMEERGGW
jgi:hypothetical protein